MNTAFTDQENTPRSRLQAAAVDVSIAAAFLERGRARYLFRWSQMVRLLHATCSEVPEGEEAELVEAVLANCKALTAKEPHALAESDALWAPVIAHVSRFAEATRLVWT